MGLKDVDDTTARAVAALVRQMGYRTTHHAHAEWEEGVFVTPTDHGARVDVDHPTLNSDDVADDITDKLRAQGYMCEHADPWREHVRTITVTRRK